MSSAAQAGEEPVLDVLEVIEANEDARGGRLCAAGPVIAGVEGRFDLIFVDDVCSQLRNGKSPNINGF